jgi:hypothetical protein
MMLLTLLLLSEEEEVGESVASLLPTASHSFEEVLSSPPIKGSSSSRKGV